MVSAITDQKKSVWEVNWHWEQKDIIAGSEKKKSWVQENRNGAKNISFSANDQTMKEHNVI